LNSSGIWQRNYYEHIIRNETEFKASWDYIDDNPRKWDEDQLHPKPAHRSFDASIHFLYT
jgi:hypothetical protein